MSLKRDILTTGFVKVFRRIVLGFVSTLILTRWLGPEGLGVYTTFMVVPMILQSLAELGVRQSAAYMTGKKLASDVQVGRALVSLWLVGSLLALTLVLIAYHVQGMSGQSVVCITIGMALVPASLITRYANGIALGKQWIPKMNIGETVQVLSRVGLFAALLIGLHWGVQGALATEVFAAFVPGLLMLHWLRRDAGICLIPSWDRALIWPLITHGFKFALALFVLSLNYRVSILILQRFVSTSDVGQFSLGVKIAEMTWLIPGAAGMVLFSHSTGATDSIHFAHTTSQVMRLTTVICGLGIMVLGVLCKPFVSIVFGPEYLPSVPVIRAILPGCLAAAVFKVLNADLAGRGYPLAAMWVYLAALCLNVLSSLVLIPLYGVVGSSLATSISYIAGALAFAWVYARMSDMSLRRLFCQPLDDWRTLRAAFVHGLPHLKTEGT